MVEILQSDVEPRTFGELKKLSFDLDQFRLAAPPEHSSRFRRQ